MNKKFFFSMFAATGMLLATSCSNDELTAVQSADEVQVSFALGLEGGIGSRAISDGTGAKKLVCAVYDANLNILDEISINNEKVNENGQFVNTSAFNGGLKDQINVTLAKGQQYTIAFWAQNPGCEAYDTDNLKEVSVNYKALNENNEEVAAANNDETRDAFFAAETFKVSGNKEINITLKRPFAQINVGVTPEDWTAAVKSGIEIKKSAVVINNAANTINLLTGAVSGNETVVTYASNNIPDEPLYVETDATKEGKEEYKWLSMSYILVDDKSPIDEDGMLGDEQATLNGLQYTFTPEEGKGQPIEFKEGLAGAPVQRNWRTNILGKILTGDIQFNITIDPVYDGDIIYPNGQAQELELAAAFGGTVTLTEDVTLTTPLYVTSDMILNMNGKIISGNFAKNDGVALINNSAKLTIMGGTIKSTADNGAAAIWNTGNLVLNGVKIEGAPIADGAYPEYAVYNDGGTLVVEEGTEIISDRGTIRLENGADVTINGGNFTVTDALGTRVLTAHVIYAKGSSSKLTINNGTFTMNYAPAGNTGASVICPAGATINVYNGNFTYAGPKGGQGGVFQNYMGYNAPVNVYGGVYNDNTVTKNGNLATGYKAVEKNGEWFVVADDVTVAASSEEVKSVFENGGNILLADDIAFEKITSIEPGAEVYLNLNGKTITVDENTTSNTLMYVKEGAKLTIDGNGTIDLGEVSTMAIFAPYGELVIENGTFIRNKVTTVTNKTTGLFMGAKTTGSNVTINGGYFDSGYYNADAAEIEEILAGTKTLEETADDIAKRDNSKDANKVRVALKDNVSALLNHSGYGVFKVYGGTFVGANPAWGDEGCMLPTTPNYLRPWSYYQGALLDGQEIHDDRIEVPAGYIITKGVTADGIPTYTVNYNK